MVRSAVCAWLDASLLTSSISWVVSSLLVMPQIPSYAESMLMSFILFSSLKMLSWENFVIPVMNTNRR